MIFKSLDALELKIPSLLDEPTESPMKLEVKQTAFQPQLGAVGDRARAAASYQFAPQQQPRFVRRDNDQEN